jgi:ElaB/YqjD/DUF883 family membrane-anchored ribosome-binding protein
MTTQQHPNQMELVLDNDYAYSKISSSAMLVDLSISVWTGRKLDKSVSAEVDASKNTKGKAGNYHKNLLAGSEKLAEIGKLSSSIRNWSYSQTSPWSDAGTRLLPSTLFFDYKAKLAEYEKMFTDKVTEFLAEYDVLVSKAAFQLGDLFNREDYPAVEKVAQKFGMFYTFSPVPEAGDFRVDIGEAGMRELQERYDEAYRVRLNGAMKDVWERLHDALSKISERFDYQEGDTKKIFRDSLVENVQELTELLKHLNITNDIQLEEMRKKLMRYFSGTHADMFRGDDDMRANTKQAVDEMLKKFAI